MRTLAVAALALAACFHAVAPAPERAHPPAHIADEPEIDVYWVGHATVLVRIADKWILTDPVFARRLGGFLTRYVEPGIALADLPHIDAVLISHGHMDHLDPASLRAIDFDTLVVPPGVVDLLPALARPHRVAVLATWHRVVAGGLTITAVPARHPDGRFLIDDLWRRHGHAGYVVEYHGRTVYFAGDTAYDPDAFKAIGRRFAIDVALIPVGPIPWPRWLHGLMASRHVDAAEAMRLFADTGAQWMVPIHFGTFYKRSADELAAIEGAIAASPRRDAVRLLGIGEEAEFYY